MNMSDVKRIEALLEGISKQGGVGATPVIAPRYITLQEWAKATFSQVPHNNTLLRWVHEGHIHPKPKKINRVWQVSPKAEYK